MIPRCGDIVRDKGCTDTLGVVVSVYHYGGDWQLAIDTDGDSVPRDQVHRRACDVDVEARV